MIEFSAQDVEFMHQRGSNPEDVQHQLEMFRKGFDFAIWTVPPRRTTASSNCRKNRWRN